MSDQHHNSRQSDEEEDDLELLRLAALKSIHTKKDAPVTNYHPLPLQSRANQVVGSTYSGTQKTATSYVKGNALRLEHEGHLQGSFYPSDHNLNFQRPVSNTLETCDTRTMLEKLDISEPYIPQQILPVNNVNSITTGAAWVSETASNGYVPPYIPHKTNESNVHGVSGVQLSPRSLAFVAENNDILMRRKGENVSPNYHRSQFEPAYRPISPDDYKPMSPMSNYVPKSPSYRSPPPTSRTRPNHYTHRRSISRSPPPSRGRSPILRRRTSSRTPPPQSNRNVSPYPYYSPRSPRPSSLAKRIKSRSPVANTRYKSPLRRSRSPAPHSRHGRPNSKSPNMNGKRRSPMTVARHTHKSRLSPVLQKRSTPVHDPLNSRHTNRLRSPSNVMPNTTRSRSRSPPRKMPRRSRDRNIASSQPLRRRSPYTNERRRHDGPANGYRNRMRKRSTSPAHGGHIRKRSRTKSPGRIRREENRSRRNERNVRKETGKNEKQREEERNVDNKHRELPNKSPKITETPDLKLEPPFAKKEEVTEKKVEVTTENKENNVEQKEVEHTAVEDKQKEESEREEEEEESSDDNDGIDLFPSDESESENEGRFKLHCKTERDTTVSTPSFTKLGESSIPEGVKELKDVEAPKDQSSNRSNSRRLDDRDRGRDSYETRRREDRFRKLDSGRNSRNDRKRVNGSNSGGRRERERDSSNKFDEKKRDEKPMFKSTFQAVENEFPKSSERINEDKNISDKKSSAHLKRRLHTKDDKDSPDKEISTEKLSSVVNASSGNNGSGSSTSSGNSGNSGKKPIHLRLGAMTNTFKAPKKSSTWNSLDKV